MSRLQSALDNEVLVACEKFASKGVPNDGASIYDAIQKSNSSLKRRPKKVLQVSIVRVLEHLKTYQQNSDSEAELEERLSKQIPIIDVMNHALRKNLTTTSTLKMAVSSPAVASSDESPKKKRLANGEPLSKRHKAENASPPAPTNLSLRDIGGMDDVLLQLEELLVGPLFCPQKYEEMRVKLPKGVLLHGPPGCGKTLISKAFAAAVGVPFVEILGPSIVSGMSGESERAVRERFDEATKNAPCLMFLDEIDAIAPKRESSQSQMEKRIVAQLLTCMDELDQDPYNPVIVLASTNRPDSLDPALRRGGRFDTEINIGVPNERVRGRILKAQTRDSPIASDVDFEKLAKMTAGFVGADLHDLVGKAGSWQLSKYFEALKKQSRELHGSMEVDVQSESIVADSIYCFIERLRRPELPQPKGFENEQITMAAFEAVLPSITPSSKREGFATIPDMSWHDIGALKSVREELQISIVEPIQHPELYDAMGISSPAGVLLWGPPGCGKTLLAKAVAAESKANFISIKGPELLNKFVGESEAAVRRVFTRARSSVPCVIFFDELDALVPRRDDQGSEASARVVNTLLTELDGLNERAGMSYAHRKPSLTQEILRNVSFAIGIYVIGATNRPDMIDEAMLRPGRLETPLFVDLPGPSERVEILSTLLRGKPIDGMQEILETARTACEGYSGADLGALIREAGNCAIRRKSKRLQPQDFQQASLKIAPSVGNVEKYHRLKKKFGYK